MVCNEGVYMSKSMMVLGLCLSAVVFSGCIGNKAVVNNANQSQEQAVSEAKEFADAIASGKSTYCKITGKDADMEYWVKGKKFKIVTKVTMTNQETKETQSQVVYAIKDDQYMYSWSDASKQGVKIRIPTEEEMSKMTEQEKQALPDVPELSKEEDFSKIKDEGYAIDCKQQDVADSSLVLPTDITFVDPTEMMKKVAPSQGMDIEKLKQQYGVTE